MNHPEAAAPPPLKGRPQWTGNAGSTGPLGLTGFMRRGWRLAAMEN
jgi:hypothetical protein